jgi:hypothetical protein
MILLLIVAIIILQVFERRAPGLTYSGASPHNNDWDGTSELVKMYGEIYGNVMIVDDWISLYFKMSDIDSCNNLFIISPEKNYNFLEKLVIYRLVYEKRFNVIIFDEGPYSNDLLSYLNIPVSIKGFNYIKDVNGSPILRGKISLGNTSLIVFFAYASPLTVYNKSVCRSIASINNITVGVMCNIGNRSFLVIGDGSIAINSVIAFKSALNPYTTFLNHIIPSICDPNKKVSIYIDSTKYKPRLVTVEEMINQGHSYREIFGTLINPSRYIYVFLIYINDYINRDFVLYLSIITFVLFTVLINNLLLKNKNKMELQQRMPIDTTINTDERILISLINILCNNTKRIEGDKRYKALCKCASKRIRKHSCLENFKNIISSDKELKKYVLSIMLKS